MQSACQIFSECVMTPGKCHHNVPYENLWPDTSEIPARQCPAKQRELSEKKLSEN